MSREVWSVVNQDCGDTPSFSVIIPTYQRRERLRMVLHRLSHQIYPRDRLEAIVVCDGCTDGSAEMARGLDLPFTTVVLEQPNQGPAAARNFGLKHAKGRFVLFLDDDVLPSPLLIAEHARAHGARADQVVIGPLLPDPSPKSIWVAWEAAKLVKQYQSMEAGDWAPSPYQFYTGNASVPLEAIGRVGGFDPRLLRAEDVDLAIRLEEAGLKFSFVPKASAVHLAERSYAAWLGAAYQYGRNDVLFHERTTWNLRRVSRLFQHRHPLLKIAVSWALKYPRVALWLGLLIGVLTKASPSLRIGRFGRWACSLAFQFEYWRGISDQLGDTGTALAIVNGTYAR